MKSAALRFEDLPIEDCNLSAFVRSAPALWDADHMQEYERLLLSPSGDQDWLLIEEGVDLAREHEIESILTTANGYLGIRASIAEGDRFSRPSIFAAGIYVAEKGLGPRFAVLPHWLHVSVTVEDRRLSLEIGRVLEHRRLLDMRVQRQQLPHPCCWHRQGRDGWRV